MPSVVDKENGQGKRKVDALTADGGGLLEDRGDLRVHVDHQVLLHGDLLVARLHLLLDPVGEAVLEHGGADVGDPLLRRLGQLDLRLWQVLVDVGVVRLEVLLDLFDAESLVSGK